MMESHEIYMLVINRKMRRALKSRKFYKEFQQRLTRQEMGITIKPQFKQKPPQCRG